MMPGILLAASASAVHANDQTPLLHVHEMTFVASREGEDSVVLRAAHAEFDTDAEIARLTKVEASTPGAADGVVGMEIECDAGEVDLSTNDFIATGNVKGRTDGGREFTTEWVRYNHADGILFTEAPVVITDEGITYRGGGFDYLIRDRRFRLLGGASVVQKPKATPNS